MLNLIYNKYTFNKNSFKNNFKNTIMPTNIPNIREPSKLVLSKQQSLPSINIKQSTNKKNLLRIESINYDDDDDNFIIPINNENINNFDDNSDLNSYSFVNRNISKINFSRKNSKNSIYSSGSNSKLLRSKSTECIQSSIEIKRKKSFGGISPNSSTNNTFIKDGDIYIGMLVKMFKKGVIEPSENTNTNIKEISNHVEKTNKNIIDILTHVEESNKQLRKNNRRGIIFYFLGSVWVLYQLFTLF